jgi:hypothetical protein
MPDLEIDDGSASPTTGMKWGEALGPTAPMPLSQMPPSWSEYLGAAGGQLFHESGPTSNVFRTMEMHAARHPELPIVSGEDIFPAPQPELPPPPMVSNKDAKAEIAESGYHLDIGHGDIPREALDIMLDRAQRRADRAEKIASYNAPLIESLPTQLIMGFADPLNLGLTAIPYAGQTRLGAMIAESAGRPLMRAGLRAAAGASAGATFTASMLPLDYLSRRTEGRDFTVADAMVDLLYGTALGAGLHTVGGSTHDAIFGFRGTDRAALRPAPEAAPVTEPDTTPVRPPAVTPRTSIENMDLETFKQYHEYGSVPDIVGDDSYTRVNDFTQRPFAPAAEREPVAGVRQSGRIGPDVDMSLSTIDIGLQNGVHPEDIIATLVHHEALNTDKAYQEAYDFWRREANLRDTRPASEADIDEDIATKWRGEAPLRAYERATPPAEGATKAWKTRETKRKNEIEAALNPINSVKYDHQHEIASSTTSPAELKDALGNLRANKATPAADRDYFNKLDKYLFRHPKAGEYANNITQAYSNLSGGEFGKPISLQALFEAYEKEFARRDKLGLKENDSKSREAAKKDWTRFNQHLNTYGRDVSETLAGTPPHPAIWLLNKKEGTVSLSPHTSRRRASLMLGIGLLRRLHVLRSHS